MGFWSNLIGTTDREYHKDGSYTDRGDGHIKSSTYNSDGSLRQYTTESDPLIGPRGTNTYNSKGERTMWQSRNKD